MRAAFKVVISIVIPAGLVYLLGAFVAASWNLTEWDLFGRMMLAIVYLALLFICVVVSGSTNDQP